MSSAEEMYGDEESYWTEEEEITTCNDNDDGDRGEEPKEGFGGYFAGDSDGEHADEYAVLIGEEQEDSEEGQETFASYDKCDGEQGLFFNEHHKKAEKEANRNTDSNFWGASDIFRDQDDRHGHRSEFIQSFNQTFASSPDSTPTSRHRRARGSKSSNQRVSGYQDRNRKGRPVRHDSSFNDEFAFGASYDADFMDDILLSANRGKVIYNGRWNILLAGIYFTNAGQAGHAKLPQVEQRSTGMVVPSMYVKDILSAKEDEGASALATLVDIGLAVGLGGFDMKVRKTSMALTARKFHTSELELTKLFGGCRAVKHGSRYFLHRSNGATKATEALKHVINNGHFFELVLGKELCVQLVGFVRWVNRVRGYGCGEFASIGHGWFAVQNLEFLGPESSGYAGIEEKRKGVFGKGRYKREYEASRAVGTLRTGSMFEEYASSHGDFEGPFEVVCDSQIYTIMKGGEIAVGLSHEPSEEQGEGISIHVPGSFGDFGWEDEEVSTMSELTFEPYSSKSTQKKKSRKGVDDGDGSAPQISRTKVKRCSHVRSTKRSATDSSRRQSSLSKANPSKNAQTAATREGAGERLSYSNGSLKEAATAITEDTGGLSDSRRTTRSEPPIRLKRTSSQRSSASWVSKSSGGVKPSRGKDPTVVFEENHKGKLVISSNGRKGHRGVHGRDGARGTREGAIGADGSDGSQATRGGRAGHIKIILRVLREKNMGGIRAVFTNPYNGAKTEKDEVFYSLSDFPTIQFSAIGGKGGNGAIGGKGGEGGEGRDGLDATETDFGTDGSDGCDGGRGGRGTSGSHGGDGGHVEIHVARRDAFLLTLVDNCDGICTSELLCGGQGGIAGAHGERGKGGVGGKGGRGFVRTVRRKAITGPSGGADGKAGSPGRFHKSRLHEGRPGAAGSFEIVLAGNCEIYSGVFDQEILDVDLDGNSCLSGSTFEIGSKIDFSSVRVRNVGRMPMPIACNICFELETMASATHKYLLSPTRGNYDGHETSRCALAVGEDFGIDEVKVSSGKLTIECGHPNDEADRNDGDFEAPNIGVTCMVSSRLTCADNPGRTYRFHNLSPFRTKVNFKYPIENTNGIKGLTSICPTECLRLDMDLNNLSSSLLGCGDVLHRRVLLRYRLVNCDEYNGNDVGFAVIPSGTKVRGLKTALVYGALDKDGCDIEVQGIEPDSTTTQSSCLIVSDRFPSYQPVSIQVDLLLAKLVRADCSVSSKPEFATVQSRRHLIVCEPSYEPSSNAHVVLVTSKAVSLEHYNSWAGTLELMGITHEVYSVSRYGSFEPEFLVEGGCSLKEAFKGKLVVVLNESFKPQSRNKLDQLRPLEMFPYGSMVSKKGFDQSTRWCIMCSAGETTMEMVRSSHINWEGFTRFHFKDIDDLRARILRTVNAEATTGKINEFTGHLVYEAPIAPEGSSKHRARKEADFLWKADTLRQYSVIHNKRTVEVHAQRCRSRNPCVVVKMPRSVECITSAATMLALAEAMDSNTRARLFCAAVYNNNCSQNVKRALSFATVGDFVREVSYLRDAKIALNDAEDDCFPSIGHFTDNACILILIQKCPHDLELANRAKRDFSELLGRFQAVADSKDLRPSRIKTTAQKRVKYLVQEALESAVARIRRQWRTIVDSAITEQMQRSLKDEVYQLLGIERGESGKKSLGFGSNVNVLREDNDWTDCLGYIHSTHNVRLFRGAEGAGSVLSQRVVDDNDFVNLSPRTYKIRNRKPSVCDAEAVQARRQKTMTRRNEVAGILADMKLQRKDYVLSSEEGPKELSDDHAGGGIGTLNAFQDSDDVIHSVDARVTDESQNDHTQGGWEESQHSHSHESSGGSQNDHSQGSWEESQHSHSYERSGGSQDDQSQGSWEESQDSNSYESSEGSQDSQSHDSC